LLSAVQRLGKQHRVLLASLREEVLDRVLQTPVQTLEESLTYCGTVDYMNSRAQLHEGLSAHGVPVVDVRPGELGAALVTHYLSLKRSGST
jgi:uncharacterized protein (DUF58 family)